MLPLSQLIPLYAHTATVMQTATTATAGTNTTGLTLIRQSPGKVQGHVDSSEARHKVLN